MKKILFIAVLFGIICSGLIADSGHYDLKAVKFYDTYFAVWGTFEDEPFEDRYDGMKFEIYENDKLIGTIVVFQHWFKQDRKEYPSIGESITTQKFDFHVSSLPSEGDNIEYDDLKIASSEQDKN